MGMRPVCLIPKEMDGHIFQFNLEVGKCPNGDHLYMRHTTTAQAGPGVTWREILEEFLDNRDDDNYILKTTTFVYHRYLIYTKIKTFIRNICPQHLQGNFYPPTDDEALILYCKELVANRDYEAAGGYREIPDKSRQDFLPKD